MQADRVRNRGARNRAYPAIAALMLALLTGAGAAAGERSCAGHPITIHGTRTADVIRGTDGADVIHAYGGDDVIDAGAGRDVVCGGAGDDLIKGGDGNDLLLGGDGHDTVGGGDGNDRLLGGAGRDTLRGAAGDDRLAGGPDGDLLYGGDGHDTAAGGTGYDTLVGGPGDDIVAGGPGRDRLDGGVGDDTLKGGIHADALVGGAGADLLLGGADGDGLDGGPGIDRCNGGDGDDLAAGCETIFATERGQLPRPRTSPGPAAVALTFDDGPHPLFTPPILDILDRYGVQATFFVLGWQAEHYPDLVREIAARGHSIQNHTYLHRRLTRWSDAAIVRELDRTQEILAMAGEIRPRCYRPPFGSTDDRVRTAAGRVGLTEVMWDVDTGDWTQPSVGTIVYRALRARGGDVVLLHDAGGLRWNTVRALPGIIEGLRAKGLLFETLCD